MVGELYSLAESGKIKLLAVQSSKRGPLFPDVPTVEEEGLNGLTVKWWSGLSFAAGTPDEIMKTWDFAVAKMGKDEKFIKELEKIKLETSYLNSEDLTDLVKTETESIQS